MNTQLLTAIEIDWNRIGKESYLRRIEALRGLDRVEFTAPVTFFVGENGSGKSTLLEAIAVGWGFNPEGGTRNYNFSTYDSHSELHDALRITKGFRRANWGYFLRAESFYNVASMEEEYNAPVGRSQHLHEKSHGESFLAMVQRQFQAGGLYLMDEPESALSPQRQLTLLAELHRLSGEGAQFIIVTHSPILLGLPGAQILSFDNGPLHPCSYEETDSVRVMSMFINHRELVLKNLLE